MKNKLRIILCLTALMLLSACAKNHTNTETDTVNTDQSLQPASTTESTQESMAASSQSTDSAPSPESQEHSQDSPAKASIDITRLSATVSCGDYFCCGTIYDRTDSGLIILTAAHVLYDYTSDPEAHPITVTIENTEYKRASLLNSSDALDIAFLYLEDTQLSSSFGSISFPISDDHPIAEETIYLVNATTGDICAGSVASPKTYCEELGMDMIYCYCDVVPGMSGAGLFDEDGNFLGLLIAGSDEVDALCLDAASIKEFYDHIS